MTRPRAADDFETIRARMEELRRERTYTLPLGKDTRGVAQAPRSFDVWRGDLRDDQNWRNDSNTRTGNRREDGEQHAAARLLAAEGVVRSGRLFLLEMTDQGGSLGHD